MGLMYVFPVSKEETDFVIENNGELTLKSYGLPYIFWIYALCIISVIFFMFIAIKQPILKLVELGDDTDAMLGYSLLTFIGSLPIAVLGFFFYEKRITKNKNLLGIQHRVFSIPVFTEKFMLESSDHFEVTPYLTSPNVARMKSNEENAGFQNKGYFVLKLVSSNGKKIQIDRHSRKVDLEKLKNLLENA